MYIKNLNVPVATYREAWEYLLNDINMNEQIVQNYEDFMNHRIKEIMSIPVVIDNRFMIDLSDWYIDSSNTESIEIAKREKLTREVLLKSRARISWMDTETVKSDGVGVVVDISIARIPALTSTGSFTINGVDRVMVSHLELTSSLMKCLDRDKKKRYVQWKNMMQTSVTIHDENKVLKLAITNGISNKGEKLGNGKIKIKNLFEQMDFTTTEEVYNVIGRNPRVLFGLEFSNNTQRSGKARYDMDQMDLNKITSIPVSTSERRQMNADLSMYYKSVGFKLAKQVQAGKVLYTAGTVITREMADEFKTHRVNRIFVETEFGEYPILSNGMVPLKQSIVSGVISEDNIPSVFIDRINEYTGEKEYKDVNASVLEEILLQSIESIDEDIYNILDSRQGELLGTTLTKEDILAMINTYSLLVLNVYKPDDRDSLDFKRITSISDVFSVLLMDRINGVVNINSRSDKGSRGKRSYISGESVYSKYKGLISGVDFKSQGSKLDHFLEKFTEDIFKDNVPSFADALVKDPLNKLFVVESNINPLEEISSKRKVTQQHIDNNFPGISDESSDGSPRGVKPSHAGRLCCIETPESGSVGLVLHLAALARINRDGSIESPFFKVDHERKCVDISKVYYMLAYEEARSIRSYGAKICDSDESVIEFTKNGVFISETRIYPVWAETSKGVNIVNREDIINQAEIELSKLIEQGKADAYVLRIRRTNWFEDEVVDAFKDEGEIVKVNVSQVEYVAASPLQLTSLAAGTTPLNQYSDGVRQLMGTQMEKQSEPVLGSEKSTLRSNTVDVVSKHTSGVIIAPYDAIILEANGKYIKIKSMETNAAGVAREDLYEIGRVVDTSEHVLIYYMPTVREGDIVCKGDILADSTSTEQGEFKFGINALVGYMLFEGYNFEDGILVNERLYTEDILTSFRSETIDMFIEPGEQDVIKYKHVNHKLTRKDSLVRLGRNATLAKGEKVSMGDVVAVKLVKNSKARDKAESELTLDDYEIQTYKYEQEQNGIVIDVLRRESKLPQSGETRIHYEVVIATEERLQAGDKMSGRHGNKGVIGMVLPKHEMPYLEDGTPFDIILTPLGIPSRMNLGQIIENPLSMILEECGCRAVCRSGETINMPRTKKLIKDYFGESGKLKVYDGRTGKLIDKPIVAGISTFGKLKHLSQHKLVIRGSDKVNYTVYGQPPQGRKQSGGQKIGEMEMDSFQSHGAENVLQELLSKSDDYGSRMVIKERREKGTISSYTSESDNLGNPNISESLRQALTYQRGLGITVKALNDNGEEIDIYKDKATNYDTRVHYKEKEYLEKFKDRSDIKQDYATPIDIPDFDTSEFSLFGNDDGDDFSFGEFITEDTEQTPVLDTTVDVDSILKDFDTAGNDTYKPDDDESEDVVMYSDEEMENIDILEDKDTVNQDEDDIDEDTVDDEEDDDVLGAYGKFGDSDNPYDDDEDDDGGDGDYYYD